MGIFHAAGWEVVGRERRRELGAQIGYKIVGYGYRAFIKGEHRKQFTKKRFAAYALFGRWSIGFVEPPYLGKLRLALARRRGSIANTVSPSIPLGLV